MILITGMPRSGTSFLNTVFHHYGHMMEPRCFGRQNYNPSNVYNLSEPGVLGKLCNRGANRDSFKDGIEQIKRHWANTEAGTDELVIKILQFSFYPGVCREFSKIIICVSSIDDRYIKSAKGHNMQSWLRGDANFLWQLKDRTLKGLALLWSKKAYELKNHHPKKTLFFEFGNKDHFDSIFLPYMNQALVDEAYTKYWRGSRFR